MTQPPRQVVIWPDDKQYREATRAYQTLRSITAEAMRSGKPWAVVFKPWEPPRTDPQRKTLWMWHGEVASELTVRTGRRWSKEDVHELVFIQRFMPMGDDLVDFQTGEVIHRRKRTGEATKPQISEAMTAYLAWIYEMGIDVTVPEDGRW